MERIDSYIAQWSSNEGQVWLILPIKLLRIHQQAIDAFNEFTDTVKEFSNSNKSRDAIQKVFKKIQNVKNKMENGFRKFLITEKLLK